MTERGLKIIKEENFILEENVFREILNRFLRVTCNHAQSLVTFLSKTVSPAAFSDAFTFKRSDYSSSLRIFNNKK